MQLSEKERKFIKIAIIDADLIGRTNHRFPNLALMKISGYYKELGHNVILKLDYGDLNDFDEVYISKVFTDTSIDEAILNLSNVRYGGTGFYYDDAPSLPFEIEHHMPDYHLYDNWVDSMIESGVGKQKLSYYTDYSIGFLTRGCFRQCKFCVNRNKKKSVPASPINEFLDESRPKVCLLDDNFFACKDWRDLIYPVKLSGKKFQFKQGLDERLLTDEIIKEIYAWNYDGDFIFAFDNVSDKELIERKLQCIFALYPNWKKRLKFYVLCGYDEEEKYDDTFWIQDIADNFERIRILSKYSALPYIMRYEKCYTSKYKGTYINIASWCNQPSIFKKFSYRDYCKCRGMSNNDYKIYHRDYESYLTNVGKKGSSWKYLEQFENEYPNIANKYFDFVPDSVLVYGNGNRIA